VALLRETENACLREGKGAQIVLLGITAYLHICADGEAEMCTYAGLPGSTPCALFRARIRRWRDRERARETARKMVLYRREFPKKRFPGFARVNE